jgi:hypothetical protein
MEFNERKATPDEEPQGRHAVLPNGEAESGRMSIRQAD